MAEKQLLPSSGERDASSIGGNRKRLKLDNGLKHHSSIPSFNFQGLPDDADSLLNIYNEYKAVHLSNFPVRKGPHLSWKALQSIFKNMSDEDKETWCVEQGSSSGAPNDFLDPSNNTRGYCSFLLHQQKEETLSKLPIEELPDLSWTYGPAVWFFFGRNQGETALDGRPEHTDAVSHDGTWHYQLSGSKRWFLRPTEELRKEFLEKNVDWNTTTGSVTVQCQEGDVLIINTRLWWHQTEIPQQDVPSVSYARDFYFASNDLEDQEPMCNVDGVYAATEIEVGTVIFREDEMPECSLHRSLVPNCEVVELEDGTCAVVSCRKIALGEFFSVPQSSDEEESELEDDDDSSLLQ